MMGTIKHTGIRNMWRNKRSFQNDRYAYQSKETALKICKELAVLTLFRVYGDEAWVTTTHITRI
jgi:hypothetical protein